MNSTWKEIAFNFIEEKTKLNLKRLGANFPHASKNKHYELENEQWWTAGFWPGILWHIYIKSGDEELKATAQQCEIKMEHLLTDTELIDHDMGFMWTLTSLASYKITGSREARRRALLAASLLLGRFNSQGNYIRAWNRWNDNSDNTGIVIIDSMMNLPLLYWATEETGDPRFKHAAEKHGERILENFIREDGSVQQMVNFDSETGEVLEKLGGQGFSVDSAWSRGCAWAIYGFALSYKYTKNVYFLNAAKKIANFFIENIEGEKCPVWDFRVPEDGERKYSYPDSSSAAITACGLLLLAECVTKAEALLYEAAGENMLKNLYYVCATIDDKEEEGMLRHGTGHFPEQKNLDTPLIYGDYFFTEGIARLNGEDIRFW